MIITISWELKASLFFVPGSADSSSETEPEWFFLVYDLVLVICQRHHAAVERPGVDIMLLQ